MNRGTVPRAPLSFQQEEQLRRLQEHPGCATSYDLVRLYELDGAVDIECLTASIDDLVRRHAILRTTIEHTGTGYGQQVHDCVLEPLTVSTARDCSVAGLASELVSLRYTLRDVCAGKPLFRPAVHMLGATALLSISLHHLIYDGWALTVLWRDLAELYRARRERRKPDLPLLPITYAQFAQSQRALWPQVASRAVPYWRDVLAGAPDGIEWPAPRDGSDSDYRTEALSFSLPPGTRSSVLALARAARVTPFIVLLSATATSIATVTGQRDLVLATDTWGREDEAKLDVVGLLANTKITRVKLGEGEPFPGLLRAVWRDWLRAERHRDAYADPTLRELDRRHVTKIGMVQQDDESVADLTLSGVTAKRVPLPLDGGYWRDFFVDWFVSDGGIRAEVFHRPSLVDRATVEAVVTGIRTTLTHVSATV